MKTSIRISLFAVVMMMTAMSFTLLPPWTTYNSTHAYSIDFPGAVTVTAKAITPTIAGGEIVIHHVSGTPTFTVDYERKTGAAYVAPATVIRDKVNKYAQSNNGTVTMGAAMAVWKGCQSQEATVQNPAGKRTNIRVAILGNECWMLIAENNGAFTPATEWTKFINSFKP